MTEIIRKPAVAAKQNYDLIITGGGIYGVMLAMEASRRGLNPLLLERDDFGGATSYHSLRIVHGGLRYLQSLDLPRFFESVGERRWMLGTFPNLVKSLPCLMPLYGEGLRRPAVMRIALGVNDLLSCYRNYQVPSECHLANGKIVNSEQVKELFPGVDAAGLQGGAVWYDGTMPDSQRLLITILRWACSLGATALNYVEAKELLTENGQVKGILAKDTINNEYLEYHAPIVVNSAGPWCRELAANFDKDIPKLFKSSIAWNVLLDRPAISDFALAIAPKKTDARTYFIRAWKGRLLVGTVHDPWRKAVTANPMPTEAEIDNCLGDINEAIPGLNLQSQEIVKILSGLLPAQEEGTDHLAHREVIFDHSQQGKISGLYSVSGVKFTTSRLVAQKTIKKIFPQAKKFSYTAKPPKELQTERGIFSYDWYPQENNFNWKEELKTIIQQEAVEHLDDLVLRRTTIGDNPERALDLAAEICELFPWNAEQVEAEINRLKTYFTARKPQIKKELQKVA